MNRLAAFWERAQAGIRSHGTNLALSLRVALAAVFALVLAQILHVPLPIWTVLTAVIVTQASVGKSVKATFDYMLGTIGGAIYTGAVGVLLPHGNEYSLLAAVAVTVAPLALLSAINPAFAVAPFTGVLVLLAPTLIHIGPVESAIYRVIEVSVGAISALIVTVLVLPARAHTLAIQAAARVLELLTQTLPELLDGFTRQRDNAVILRTQDKIGEQFGRLEVIAAEARHEMVPNFISASNHEPLLRTLLRLRHDFVMIGRAASAPLPEPLQVRLGPPLARVSETGEDFLRASRAALASGRAPPPLEAATAALESFAAEIAQLRKQRLLHDLPSDDVERIFALSFALEQLHRNFIDLARCVAEQANVPAPIARDRTA